jgi:hypothetical protein
MQKAKADGLVEEIHSGVFKKGNKAALMSVLFTLGRYELDRGPPLYRGAHTVVVAAVDHLCLVATAGGRGRSGESHREQSKAGRAGEKSRNEHVSTPEGKRILTGEP